GEFLASVVAVVQDEIYPSLAGLRATLAFDLARRARDDGRAGLSWIPGGREIYAELIEHHTTLPLGAQEVHEYGLAEVARIRAEMERLGGELFGTTGVEDLQARLRNDPELFFDSREAVVAKAEEALGRAERAAEGYFLRAPMAASVVVEVPEHEAAHTTIAYYREPAADGSRPGRYYVNASEPTTRPRYDAEVLAFHEAVPGHHYQIALSQELEDLPLFRRHLGTTAFVEGWALYSERLADEMGLYSSELDRLGMLSFDAWRACRLVVDTGLHEYGWSRKRAIDYLYENTLLSRNNCENEVDRYIAWPGQALAYKLGAREIQDLRLAAERTLGERFDVATFHDQILRNGALPLSILRDQVNAWIERVGS
ncbi:MAG TPA: DUF885 domain-containing protein, partial [Planctomycetota bacterium]|nr:DUF885 domain-containing protein [Planctomycetota bacterium]